MPDNWRSVVITASQYPDLVIVDLVNQSMRLIDTSGPTALQLVFQRFRLPMPANGSLCISRIRRMMR